MNRSCQRCGKDFLAQRPTAKYCTNVCRSAASKARAKQSDNVVQLRTPTAPAVGDLSVEDHARRELGDAVSTTLGQMCLTAARRIDSGEVVGAALSSTMKRLEEMMEAAERLRLTISTASNQVDPVEYLKARGERRRTAG